jgi:predicted dehydrogenase
VPASSTASQRLRIGLVGGGLIAQIAHLPLLHADPTRFELAALADPSTRVRERLAARYGIPHTCVDHRALMELPLDAVIVCAPNPLHAAIVLDGLDAGLHVLVEKPLCLSVADADRIADRGRETSLVVQVGYMKRFSPACEALAADLAPAAPTLRLVSSVTVDPVLARDFTPPGFVGHSDVPPYALAALDANTVAQVAEEIGSEDPAHARSFADAFLGALVHDVNVVQGLLGPVAGDVVDAYHEPAGRVAGGTLELPGGGRWSLSWLLLDGAGCFSEDLRFLADEGEWRLRLPAPYLRPTSGTFSCRRRARAGGWHTASDESYADPYARQLAHFHACVTTGTPCRNGPGEARDDIALLTRLFRGALAAEVAA